MVGTLTMGTPLEALQHDATMQVLSTGDVVKAGTTATAEVETFPSELLVVKMFSSQ
jgi:urease accessory protein UreE